MLLLKQAVNIFFESSDRILGFFYFSKNNLIGHVYMIHYYKEKDFKYFNNFLRKNKWRSM